MVGRRGNHHVMARATYSNVRSRNHMVHGREGCRTRYQPGGEEISFFRRGDALPAAREFRWSCLRAANSVPAVAVTGLRKGPRFWGSGQ